MFSKKNKSKTAKADFKVVLWEDVGYSVREIKTFDAQRYLDEDKVPFIYNESLNFMELYPQDMKDNVKLDEKEINKKLDLLIADLKKIRAKKIEDYKENEPNTKDLEFEITKLQAKKRALKFDSSASYVSFDREGQVTFNFLRKGSTFFPFKWDTDTNFIHTAAEPVTKKAGILLRNKDNKYSPKKLIETTTLIMLIVVVVGSLANIFFGGWLWSKWDDSSLAEMEKKNIEIQTACSEMVLNNAKSLTGYFKEYQSMLNGTKNIQISGIIPE